MRRIWNRSDDVERRLRAARPEPSRELLDTLVARVSSRPYRRSARLRVGLAAATSAVFAISLGAFGGLGYAASAASHAAKVAVTVVTNQRSEAKSDSKGNSGEHRSTGSFGNQQGTNQQGNNHQSPPPSSQKHDEGHDGRGSDDDQSSAEGEYGSKVTLCHNGETIRVSQNAVGAHLALGDTLGQCAASGGHGHHD